MADLDKKRALFERAFKVLKEGRMKEQMNLDIEVKVVALLKEDDV